MKKDVVWGYLSQFLQYGAALLILPLLLRKLSSAELGVWYVFMTIAALVTMLDMGFTPTLARNVSYVLGGARRLFKNGLDILETPSPVDYSLFKVLIKSARRIFMIISCGAALILSTVGSWYILYITHEQIEQQSALVSWAIFVVATVINIYYKYYTPLLQGRGMYGAFYKSSAISNLGFIAVTAIILQFDFGLVAVAVGYLVSALLGRWLSWWYFYDEEFKFQLNQAPEASVSSIEIYSTLWHNAWRLGLGVIGSFFILRANTLLTSAYLGLATTAAYALTLQVFSVLQALATVVFNIQQPILARYRITNQRTELVKTMELGLIFALVLFITGGLCVVWFGTPFINFFGGKTVLLTTPLLAWVGLMMLLELSHSLAASIIITGNEVPFVKPALVSGFAVIFLSYIGLKYFYFGLAWIIGVQFFVQLAYNNWMWPWLVYKKLYLNK